MDAKRGTHAISVEGRSNHMKWRTEKIGGGIILRFGFYDILRLLARGSFPGNNC